MKNADCFRFREMFFFYKLEIVIKNENTIVSSLVSKEQIQTAEIEELVEKKFAGSIPAFLTAFTKSQQLTADEIQEMQQMIDRFRKEHPDD